jgi:hypothetical protein
MAKKRNRLSEVFSVAVPGGGLKTEWESLFDRARSRVDRSPRLRPYSDIIFGDWSPWPEHLRWVVRGRVGEIAAWAEQIRRDSE